MITKIDNILSILLMSNSCKVDSRTHHRCRFTRYSIILPHCNVQRLLLWAGIIKWPTNVTIHNSHSPGLGFCPFLSPLLCELFPTIIINQETQIKFIARTCTIDIFFKINSCKKEAWIFQAEVAQLHSDLQRSFFKSKC